MRNRHFEFVVHVLVPFLAYISLQCVSLAAEQKDIQIVSPSGDVAVEFSLTEQGEPLYSVHCQSRPVVVDSALGLLLENGPTLDAGFRVAKSSTSSHHGSWEPVLGERSTIVDNYHELTIELQSETKSKAKLNLTFRAYDEGFAFCYTIPEQSGISDFVIAEESTRFRFANDHLSWSSSAPEKDYDHVRLSELKGKRGRPMVVEVEDGPYVAVGEARLVDYARMRFERDQQQEHTLSPALDGTVEGTAPFTTPWRYLMIADTPGELVENNDLVRNLNDPCAIEDTSWIRPGKVFRSMLTTEGGKAAVDLAVKMNLQHILLDAGWYGSESSNDSDATTVTVDPKRYEGPLELQTVIDYATDKGIGVFLYINRRALEKQLDEILPLFQKWGVTGIKFGFVNVGPQKWTQWVHESVKKCADYKILVDIHDHYLPTGWSRTYPNLLTQEGIRGNEQMPTPKHNVTLPFIRFLCGAGDYTVCYYSGRIQTTRAHQLAASIVYYSPMQLLFWYDKPQQYRGEPELEVFKQLKTTWDETKVIHGEIGNFVTTARRSNKQWFVGSMNANEQRTLEIPLNFLEAGVTYEAFVCSDEDPAGNAPTKVKTERISVTSESILSADMANNGGHAVVITPVE